MMATLSMDAAVFVPGTGSAGLINISRLKAGSLFGEARSDEVNNLRQIFTGTVRELVRFPGAAPPQANPRIQVGMHLVDEESPEVSMGDVIAIASDLEEMDDDEAMWARMAR